MSKYFIELSSFEKVCVCFDCHSLRCAFWWQVHSEVCQCEWIRNVRYNSHSYYIFPFSGWEHTHIMTRNHFTRRCRFRYLVSTFIMVSIIRYASCWVCSTTHKTIDENQCWCISKMNNEYAALKMKMQSQEKVLINNTAENWSLNLFNRGKIFMWKLIISRTWTNSIYRLSIDGNGMHRDGIFPNTLSNWINMH